MGVTGSAIAMPLLAASGAHAADTATWDRVAQCESGGMWSAASGNGFYGGLQLTQDMWDEYGGAAYASRPDLASRAQQISVAEKILDDRGPDAWPSCAVNAGLKKDGRAPEVDPGGMGAPTPDPSDTVDPSDPLDPSDSSDSSDAPDRPGDSSGSADPSGPFDPSDPSDVTPSPSAPDGSDAADPSDPSDPSDPDGPGDPSEPADPSDSSKTPDPSDSTTPGGDRGDDDGASDSADPGPVPSDKPAKGRHRGGADETKGDKGSDSDAGDGGRSSGRHASRGDDAHRAPAADGDYTVRPGDTLSAIAAAHELPGGWPALYGHNKGVIGSDADLIHPGQILDLGN
ncbi:transglycosylase family protein [Streptomyces sp. NPDC050636]|uniref:transglycosylase family protein n=1 Tax=Streptomyces sp. NPDC050636 TaxID=3154510 RepID=UPI00343B8D81